jgi:hypothetical protein
MLFHTFFTLVPYINNSTGSDVWLRYYSNNIIRQYVREGSMKYHRKALIVVAGISVIMSVCAKEPSRISIAFTAVHYPNIIKHGGYYFLQSTNDTAFMNGSTPSEYVITLEYEDTLFLCCWKDTVNNDTLQLDIYVDGIPEIEKGYIQTPFYAFEYRYPPEGVEQ